MCFLIVHRSSSLPSLGFIVTVLYSTAGFSNVFDAVNRDFGFPRLLRYSELHDFLVDGAVCACRRNCDM